MDVKNLSSSLKTIVHDQLFYLDLFRSILEAKSALVELTQDLSERTLRWRQIELLCGFQILSPVSNL